MLDPNALQQLEQHVLEAFEEANDHLYNAIYDAFEAEVYAWDGTITFRQNGEIVDSPRDIDDTGGLKESQHLPEIEATPDGYTATHRNNAPHAHDVYFGYLTDSGVEKPGRDWIEEALSNVDLGVIMTEELQRRLN